MMKHLRLLCLLTLLSACVSAPTSTVGVQLQFRPASYSQAPGMTEMPVKGEERKVYVSDQILLSNEDVASARPTKTSYGYCVAIQLTREGARKFAQVTEQNLMKPIAILVDGEVLSAPIVQERITGGTAMISGTFTIDEARRIASGFRK